MNRAVEKDHSSDQADPIQSETLLTDKRARVVVWMVLSVILVLSALQRIYPADSFVHPESGETRLLGVDAYFYLRHAVYFSQELPDVPTHDYGASYPNGLSDTGVGLHGLSIGLVAAVLGLGNPSLDLVTEVAAWAPVVWGVLSCLFVFLLGRALGGPFLGLLAAFLYLLFPATSLNRTLLGFADHHAAEVLLVVTMLFGWIRSIQKTRDRPETRSWRPSFLLGAPFYLFFFTWNGAPIYAVIFTVIILILASYLTASGQSLSVFAGGCFRFFAPHIVVFSLVWLLLPDLIVLRNSTFRLLILASGFGLAFGPWILARIVEILRRRDYGDVLIGTGLGVISLGLLAFFFLGTESGTGILTRVLGERTTAVREQGNLSFIQILKNLGASGVLTLLALPLVFIASWKKEKREETLLAVLLAAIMLYVYWSAHDFDYIPPPLAAVAGSIGLWMILRSVLNFRTSPKKKKGRNARRARRRKKGMKPGEHDSLSWSESPRLRQGVVGVLFVCVVFGAWWPLDYAKPWLSTFVVRSLVLYTDGWYEAMNWMKEATPDPFPALEMDESPRAITTERASYGVMTAWDFGNIVSVIGERSPVYSKYFRVNEGRFFAAASEEEALSLLCPVCGEDEPVPYVVVDARTAGDFFAMKADYAGNDVRIQYEGNLGVSQEGRDIPHATFGDLFANSITSRLYLDDGAGLEHFRMVYESPEQSYVAYQGSFTSVDARSVGARVQRQTVTLSEWVNVDLYRRMEASPVVQNGPSYLYDQRILSTVKVFERVTGSVVTGNLQPGSEISINLPLLVSTTGREFTYRTSAFADEDGHVELILPYSTRATGTDVITALSPYIISYRPDTSRTETMYGRLDLTETDVQTGAGYTARETQSGISFTPNTR